jgi:hypothetical protein
MYFKKLSENIGTVPDYVIENMLDSIPEINRLANTDPRKIFGDNSKTLSMLASSQELKAKIEFIQNFILSQQFDFLKNLIPYERTSVVPGSTNDATTLPNRYINRIGESVVVTISGSCTISCHEFADKETISTGSMWRINTRIPMNYEYSSDFVAVVITYIDFDLAHYLMPFDVHGVFPRRRDEWLDSESGDSTTYEIDKSAY